MPEEQFDVVDEADCVLRQAPRSEVHRHKWLHRAVHIFLRSDRGELLLQLRSALKDEYPLCYTSSASGHLSAGEDYASAAPRELAEELGIATELTFLHKFTAGPETSFEHTVLYEARHNGPFTWSQDEISELEFLTLDEISRRIRETPERFSPCLVTLFNWYVTRGS